MSAPSLAAGHARRGGRQVAALRRARWTGARIAPAVALSRATVGRILRRLGLARLRQLAPAEPVHRYERARPGELLHVDIKKLGRIAGLGHRITGDRRHRARGVGWEYVHVAIDDCSRLSYAEVLRDERGETVAAFLRRAMRWFARRGVRIERVLSDNGSAYRSRVVAAACQALHVAQRWTRPYRPQTNGKAERFIQTLLREWAYGRPYSARSPARLRCRPGCTTTIGTAPMAAFTDVRPSAEWSRRTIS